MCLESASVSLRDLPDAKRFESVLPTTPQRAARRLFEDRVVLDQDGLEVRAALGTLTGTTRSR